MVLKLCEVNQRLRVKLKIKNYKYIYCTLKFPVVFFRNLFWTDLLFWKFSWLWIKELENSLKEKYFPYSFEDFGGDYFVWESSNFNPICDISGDCGSRRFCWLNIKAVALSLRVLRFSIFSLSLGLLFS